MFSDMTSLCLPVYHLTHKPLIEVQVFGGKVGRSSPQKQQESGEG